ncbi:MAG: hypothetical protein WAM24_00360, partial [Ignavibacteriaceae bacterium]
FFSTFLSIRKVAKEACSTKELPTLRVDKLKNYSISAKINKLGLPAGFLIFSRCRESLDSIYLFIPPAIT